MIISLVSNLKKNCVFSYILLLAIDFSIFGLYLLVSFVVLATGTTHDHLTVTKPTPSFYNNKPIDIHPKNKKTDRKRK